MRTTYIGHKFVAPTGTEILHGVRMIVLEESGNVPGFKWAIWHICCRTGWRSLWND